MIETRVPSLSVPSTPEGVLPTCPSCGWSFMLCTCWDGLVPFGAAEVNFESIDVGEAISEWILSKSTPGGACLLTVDGLISRPSFLERLQKLDRAHKERNGNCN